MKDFIKKNKIMVILIVAMIILTIVNVDKGIYALKLSGENFLTMLSVLPPIFILIGLLDVWIPKETMIKYMGDDSGAKGLFFAFLLGSLAAGPLYAAFPVASLLLRKGARFAYVLFFLGTWSAAKVPLILFEMTSLGVKFTVIHVVTMLSVYLVTAFYIEKLLKQDERRNIIMNLESM